MGFKFFCFQLINIPLVQSGSHGIPMGGGLVISQAMLRD